VLFSLLYVSTVYSPQIDILNRARIPQEQAIQIADNDLRNHLDDYHGILKIIVNSTSGYVPIDEIKTKNMTLPIVYVSPSGQLILFNRGIDHSVLDQENLGYCNEPLSAYCGFLPHFNFDYRGKVVYGVEVIASYDDAYGVPFLYIVDAVNGDIVDSTFLRDEKIRSMTNGE
jgi:hypothetical protein